MALASVYNFLNLILVGLLLYLLRLIYRVTFHPLAKFPGPWLGALTNWYAFSYDLSGKESLVKHLKKLHDQYGPIVRVRPDEIHVFDWDAYHTVFKHNSGYDRTPEMYAVPVVMGSLLTTLSSRAARPHRELFTGCFSKASINEFEPLIHEKVNLFLSRLQEAATQGKTVPLNMAFECLTGDVVMHFSYQMSLDLLKTPDFRPKLIVGFQEFAPGIPVFWYFTTTGTIMNTIIFNILPDPIVRFAFPAAAGMKDVLKQCKQLINSLAQAPVDSKEVQTSVFRTALNPNKEKGQYVATEAELTADALLLFLAGTDTTAITLTLAVWHLIKQPQYLQRLREELSSAIPDTSTLLPQRRLESLPFLRAVIKESLRFSMGVCARLPRFVPASGATFCGQTIAPGSRVSFSIYVYNNDPAIFPDPHTFNPDRWMGSKEQTDYLDSHMISFSKGSRMCLGINLAYAELYNGLAHFVRRFDVTNDGTTEHDMDWLDTFGPTLFGDLNVKLRLIEK